MTVRRICGDDFPLPEGNSRCRRRPKRTGANAVLTGDWGRSATNKQAAVYTEAYLLLLSEHIIRCKESSILRHPAHFHRSSFTAEVFGHDAFDNVAFLQILVIIAVLITKTEQYPLLTQRSPILSGPTVWAACFPIPQ